MLWNCLAVALGGACGSVLRYLLGLLSFRQYDFPWITLGINGLGAFLIGVVVALSGKYTQMDARWILFLQVGFCGGFTTFSTFSNEALGLLEAGKLFLALVYMILSVVLCLGAVFGAKCLIK